VYQFVVQFLRYFLAPIFEIHELREASDQVVLVKWSWTMNFWWNRYNIFKFIWDPQLVFSGISLLGYSAETGAWRSISVAVLLQLIVTEISAFITGACHVLANAAAF